MKHRLYIGIGFLSILLSTLACSLSLPNRAQLEGGVETVQAVGQQASDLATRTAPTLQAAAQQASDLATRSAPTLQAAADQARDFAQNAGPTLQAARTRASAYATEAAPTVIALQTQAVAIATSAGPTIEAGLEQLATAAVDTQERAQQAQATLQAAGIDGGYLFRKVAALRPDETGRIIATFTEDEVNIALNARLLLAKEQGEDMRDARVRFTNGVIQFKARINNPVEGEIELLMIPYVDAGELRYELVSAFLNGREMPPFVRTRVEALLNNTLGQSVNALPNSIVLQTVFVEEGTLTFVAERNR